jgi:hypothetical protein
LGANTYDYGTLERQRMFGGESAYHKVTGGDLYLSGSIPRLREKDLKQLWRNQLLGEAMKLGSFRSVLLYPRANHHAAEAAAAYSALLLPARQSAFAAITFEDWLSVLREAANEPQERAWVQYLADRYEVPLSED